ncbi:MAG: L-rhamnose mutarotase [Bacteroidales bacterium]|nr:L-rhamnose mutarotase [Bacteroidales bacterium]
MKRYCQTLNLVDDPELIEKYCEAHAHVWPEIQEGIRSVGILDMQIYRLDTKLFMICDTVDDFDWEKDNARLAMLPRQAEWEAYVAQFQGSRPDAPSTEKWHLMDKIFELDK